jgi:N6-adenosine-specific RNA methylase IME4
MKKYKTIVADPPWKYGKWGKADPKTRPNCKEYDMPYDTMSVEEIKALNVASLADENCELYWMCKKPKPYLLEFSERKVSRNLRRKSRTK